jgi:hypothetical protein
MYHESFDRAEVHLLLATHQVSRQVKLGKVSLSTGLHELIQNLKPGGNMQKRSRPIGLMVENPQMSFLFVARSGTLASGRSNARARRSTLSSPYR